MTKNNEQDEMSKDLLRWLEEDDPLGLNEEIKTTLFRCKDCHGEDDVPDFVVSEFMMDRKKGERVQVQCPHCGGTMFEARKSPK